MNQELEKDSIKQRILQQLKKRFDKKQERHLEELLYQNHLQRQEEQKLEIIESRRVQEPLNTPENNSILKINARLQKHRFLNIKVASALSESPKETLAEHSQQSIIQSKSSPNNSKNKINIYKEYRHLKRGHIQTEPQSAQLRGSHHSRIVSEQVTQLDHLRTSTLNVPKQENDVRLSPLGNIKNSRKKIPHITINMLRKQQQQNSEQSQGTTAASSAYSSSTIDPDHFETPKQIYLTSTLESQNKDMQLMKSNHSKQQSWNGPTFKNSLHEVNNSICYSRLLISAVRNEQKEQARTEVLRQLHCGNPEAVLEDIHEEDDSISNDEDLLFEDLTISSPFAGSNHFQNSTKFSGSFANQIKDNKFSIKVIPTTMKREIMEQQIERLRELKFQMNHPQNNQKQFYIRRSQLHTPSNKDDSPMNQVRELSISKLPYFKISRQ